MATPNRHRFKKNATAILTNISPSLNGLKVQVGRRSTEDTEHTYDVRLLEQRTPWKVGDRLEVHAYELQEHD